MATFLEALQGLQQLLRDVAARKSDALLRLNTDPAEGLERHEALLAEVPGLQARIDAFIDIWRHDAQAVAALPAQDEWLRDWLVGHRVDLELSTAMGHYRVGDSTACRGHLANYADLSAGRHDPSRPTALDLLARLELEAGRPDRAREHAVMLEAEARHWTTPAAWQGIAPEGDEDEQARRAWRNVAAARALLADLALAEGRREAFVELSREAQAHAEHAGADDMVRVLWWARATYELTWDTTGSRLDRAEAALRDNAPPTVRTQPDFQRRLLQARAQVWAERGRPQRALPLLEQALALIEPDDPAAAWSLRLDVADLHSNQGRHDDALREADAAVDAARRLQSATVLRQCLDRRRGLRLDSGDPATIEAALAELDAEEQDDEPAGDTATRLQTRVRLLLSLGRHHDALATLDRLESQPAAARETAAVTAANLAGLRAGVLRDAGRIADAVLVLQAAADALEPAEDEAVSWRDRNAQWRTLVFGAALNLAELGRIDESLAWCDRGHRRIWARALARHGREARALDAACARRDLASCGCALIVPMIGKRRTIVLVFPADGREPQAHRLDVGRDAWQQRFALLETGAAQWNPRFLDNLDVFSQWMGPCLDDAVRGARQLVVVPEGVLALVPWAGVRLPGGEHLVQRVATVLVPALAFGARRRAGAGPLRLLSVGAGTTGTQDDLHDFSAMARDIARRYTRGPVTELDSATRAAFVELAPAHDVVHVSLHGTVQRGRLDPLAASTLAFADGASSARQLLEAWPQGTPFEAVFLNACVSGGYAFDRDAEAGGFTQAFLELGARQLVTTLAYVDPGQAQALALAFHRAWADGGQPSAAAALRQAQQALLAAGAAPDAWATHVAVAAGYG